LTEEDLHRQRLKPTLGLFDATAISIGAIIGAGIYVVVGIAAGYAGSALTISIVITAAVSIFTALSFCELTAWQPREGSVYEYSYQLISPFAGFLTGWMWIISNTFSGAAVAQGFAGYLHALFPVFPPSWTAALLCLFFTAVNFIGVRQSALFNNVLVATKLSILGFFVIYGFFHMEPANFADFNPFQMGVLSAAFYIFFAYGGFARVAVVAEEVKDARKNVPRAILFSLLISAVVYALVGLVAVGLVGASRLASSSSPLAEATGTTGNVAAVYIVSAGGLIASASVLLTVILGVSRMMYAMARRGDLPKNLGKLHPTFNTPYYAVWIVGAVMTLLAFFVNLSRVVAVSTFALLFYYMLANVAALKLKTAKRNYPKTVSALGAATCLTFLAVTLMAKPEAWIIGVATLIAGTAYHRVKMKFTKILTLQN